MTEHATHAKTHEEKDAKAADPGKPVEPGPGMSPERIEQDPPAGRGDGKAPEAK